MTVAPKLQKGLKRLLRASSLRSIASALAVISLTAILAGYIVILVAGGTDMSSKISEIMQSGTSEDMESLLDQLGEALSVDIDLSDGDTSAPTAMAGIICLLVGLFLLPLAIGLLPLIATILVWLGIGNISRENFRFRIALFAVLASIVLSLVNSFGANSGSTLSTLFVLLANICDTVMFLFICDGIRELGGKLGYIELLGKYHRIVIFYVLTALFVCVGSILGVGTAGYVFRVLGYISSFIAYRLYLRALQKGLDAVKDVPAEARTRKK